MGADVKRVLPILGLMLCFAATPARATITFVQVETNAACGGVASCTTAAFTSIASGSFVVAHVTTTRRRNGYGGSVRRRNVGDSIGVHHRNRGHRGMCCHRLDRRNSIPRLHSQFRLIFGRGRNLHRYIRNHPDLHCCRLHVHRIFDGIR